MRNINKPYSPVKKNPVRNRLSDEQVAELREAFNLFDSEQSGQIDARELKAAMRALGFEVKKDELRMILRELGREQTGYVDFDDFCKIMSTRMHEKDSKEEIMKVFRLFDTDNTGKISLRNLKQIAHELGENLTEEELQEMINEADRDQDGLIGPEDFYRVMRKKGENPLDDLSSDED